MTLLLNFDKGSREACTSTSVSEAAWVDILKPYDSDSMLRYPVSTKLNHAQTGTASNCFSGESGWNRGGKEFRRHKSCDVRNLWPIESHYGCRLSLSCSGSRCFFAIRCFQSTCCRLFDELSDRLWLRHIHGVAAFDFDDRCAGALRHQPLRIGRKHPILGR